MGRYAIFVDAGYFFTQAAQILSSNTSKKRNELTISEPNKLRKLFVEQAEVVLGNKNLLRIYWYDGVRDGLTPMQKVISAIDDIQLRAGTINGKGEQKGVDSLIVTDLIELATNHAIVDALVITGDSDLAVGISIAQKKGVRVAVMGVSDSGKNVRPSQSSEITSIADRVILIDGAHLSTAITYTKRLSPEVNPQTQTASLPIKDNNKKNELDLLKEGVNGFLGKNPTINKSFLDEQGKIAPETDKAFLYHICQILGQSKLEPSQKISARDLLRANINNM